MSWPTSPSHPIPRTALLLSAVLFGLGLSLSGCETTGDLTVDLPDIQPTSSTFIELRMSASTVLLDPALTLKTDRFLVGRLRDQVTGVTEAQGVLNLRTSPAADSLPGKLPNAALESVVLVAPFETVYGSATTPARIDVLTLGQKLDDRVVYNAAAKPVPGAQPLVTGLSVPLNATRQTTQTTTDGTGTVVTTTVPERLLSQTLQTSTGPANPLLTSIFQKLNAASFGQPDLDAVLPGLVFAPSAGYEGSIVGFGRGRLAAQLKFRYSYDSVQTAPLPTVRRKRYYSLYFGPNIFTANSGGAAPSDPRFYTYLVNNRSGSPLASLQSTPDVVPAAALDGSSYLQAGVGLATRITFGDLTQLETLRNTPDIAINRAELRVPVRPFTTGVFPNPATFYALEVDSRNKILQRTVGQVTTERVVQNSYSPQVPATLAAASLLDAGTTSPYYSFVLTNYLQAYLTPGSLGTDPATGANLPLPAALVLTPTLRSTSNLTLDRAVLDNGDIINIKLRVYYSQLR